MNVPEIYARVCEACPEARVEGLQFIPCNLGRQWEYQGEGRYEFEAVAIIENAWTKLLLARGYVLVQGVTINDMADTFSFTRAGVADFQPTILEAAAARLAPEQRGGK